MTFEVDLLELILTLLAVAITVVLIPLLLQARKTAQQAESLLREARRELPPLLGNLREASERLNRVAAKVEGGTGKMEELADACGEIGDSFRRFSDLVHHGAAKYVGQAIGTWLGIRAAGKAIGKQIKTQKGE